VEGGRLAKTFEELRIWQQARILVKNVYLNFKADTIGHKDFGFRGQFQRAAVSVMNNIAEGFERGSKADFARFLDIAKGSCGEVRSMLYIAFDLDYIDDENFQKLTKDAVLLSKGIAALTKTLRK
jgi:four helix bundle protein